MKDGARRAREERAPADWGKMRPGGLWEKDASPRGGEGLRILPLKQSEKNLI